MAWSNVSLSPAHLAKQAGTALNLASNDLVGAGKIKENLPAVGRGAVDFRALYLPTGGSVSVRTLAGDLIDIPATPAPHAISEFLIAEVLAAPADALGLL